MDPVTTALLPSPHRAASQFSQLIVPTCTFETAPSLDLLIVPGGQGTRDPKISKAVSFVTRVYPSLQQLIAVCTGVGIAAQAGVLDGKRATTNKLSWDSTVALRPEVDWVYQSRWICDGNIWTSSGISAGIDVTLAWIESSYGETTATAIANRMEYVRATDPSQDPFATLYKKETS
ncbi:hypothetical protein PFICI_08078 [Pestalotiopsis fici W106-1]|uniref:DJ-1/PfpI domain-containing protein n=1 Tax=Pestalotiopsis fici (strain W106-1 / CGMCC3.15140) TaxID=1229662 RepID=W3X3G6_PESFW|nr:uncharacterized protein PFICI_08078 [Pestalotiopsis fici W106-1]ETS80549.1 hypothetical protein PFICI_08078 [Pestalotiopsis fici W106-1]